MSVPLTPGVFQLGSELVDVEVDDTVRQALDDLKAGALDPLEILDRRVLDEVDVAGEKRRDPRPWLEIGLKVTFAQCGARPQ